MINGMGLLAWNFSNVQFIYLFFTVATKQLNDKTRKIQKKKKSQINFVLARLQSKFYLVSAVQHMLIQE